MSCTTSRDFSGSEKKSLHPLAIPAEHAEANPTMPLSKARKEKLILAIAVSLMAAKIMLGVIMLHRWRMQSVARGEVFGADET